VHKQFTGQITDEETGLYYYGARYYDSELGRFIQPDPSGGGGGSTQSFNRYSYCDNNPLNLTDPSGHSAVTPFPSASFSGGLPSFSSMFPNPFDKIDQSWGFSSSSASEDEGFGYRRYSGQSSYDPFEFAGLGFMSPEGLLNSFVNPRRSSMEQEVIGPMFADHPRSEGISWLDVGKAALALTAVALPLNPIGITAGLGLAAIDAIEGHPVAAAVGLGATVLGAGGLASVGRLIGSAAKEGRYLDVSSGAFVDLMMAQKHAGIIQVLQQGDKEIPKGTAWGITQLMAEITAGTGREAALLRVDGKRLLRLGGPQSFSGADASRVIAHTHPSGVLEFSGGDLAAFRSFQPRQRTSMLIAPSGEYERLRIR
jgi:RHS repeat-associated protein